MTSGKRGAKLPPLYSLGVIVIMTFTSRPFSDRLRCASIPRGAATRPSGSLELSQSLVKVEQVAEKPEAEEHATIQ